MIIVIGLVILVAAVIVGVAGVLSNGGSGHALTHPFAVFGYHVTGSTGALFLYGIVVGAVALFGLSLLLAGARRTSRRGREARQGLRRSRRETAAASQDRRPAGPARSRPRQHRQHAGHWLAGRRPGSPARTRGRLVAAVWPPKRHLAGQPAAGRHPARRNAQGAARRRCPRRCLSSG
jgi:hypothetical protein